MERADVRILGVAGRPAEEQIREGIQALAPGSSLAAQRAAGFTGIPEITLTVALAASAASVAGHLADLFLAILNDKRAREVEIEVGGRKVKASGYGVDEIARLLELALKRKPKSR